MNFSKEFQKGRLAIEGVVFRPLPADSTICFFHHRKGSFIHNAPTKLILKYLMNIGAVAEADEIRVIFLVTLTGKTHTGKEITRTDRVSAPTKEVLADMRFWENIEPIMECAPATTGRFLDNIGRPEGAVV